MSVPPPGANGTITRTARAGYSWASALQAKKTTALASHRRMQASPPSG